VRIYYLRSL